MKRIFAFLMGSVIGALLGVSLTILLTPQSGEELREGFVDRFNKLKDEVKSAASSRRIELERQLANLREVDPLVE